MKFSDKTDSRLWENIWHMKASYFTLYLGKDPSYRPFNGDYKHVNVHFGRGAFRTQNFEELYEPGMTRITDPDLDETWKSGDLLESPFTNVPVFKYDVPREELDSITGDYAYAFWYRWNYFYPVRINLAS